MCKHLTGSNKEGFTCKLTKKPCKYQQYCTVTHQYSIDKTTDCPASKK